MNHFSDMRWYVSKAACGRQHEGRAGQAEAAKRGRDICWVEAVEVGRCQTKRYTLALTTEISSSSPEARQAGRTHPKEGSRRVHRVSRAATPSTSRRSTRRRSHVDIFAHDHHGRDSLHFFLTQDGLYHWARALRHKGYGRTNARLLENQHPPEIDIHTSNTATAQASPSTSLASCGLAKSRRVNPRRSVSFHLYHVRRG